MIIRKRPVAPREDEETQCAKMLIELAFLLPRGTNVAEHSAARQLVRYVEAVRANALAAAPVPCAASPADLKLVCDAAQQHYADGRIWANVHGPAYFNANMGRAENRRKLGEAIERLRATGEGARDAVKREMPNVSDAVDHRHRAIRGNDPVLPEVPEDREVAADRLAAPVAVSLDPHRLLQDWREQDRILQEIAALCDSDEHAREPKDVLQAVRDTLARLRGEASVRP